MLQDTSTIRTSKEGIREALIHLLCERDLFIMVYMLTTIVWRVIQKMGCGDANSSVKPLTEWINGAALE